jgi:hypothetical protein
MTAETTSAQASSAAESASVRISSGRRARGSASSTRRRAAWSRVATAWCAGLSAYLAASTPAIAVRPSAPGQPPPQIKETPLPLDLICHITPKQRIERNGRRNQGSSASKKERFLSCSPAAPNLGVPPPSRLASSGVLPSSSLLRRRCCIRLSRLLSLDPG